MVKVEMITPTSIFDPAFLRLPVAAMRYRITGDTNHPCVKRLLSVAKEGDTVYQLDLETCKDNAGEVGGKLVAPRGAVIGVAVLRKDKEGAYIEESIDMEKIGKFNGAVWESWVSIVDSRNVPFGFLGQLGGFGADHFEEVQTFLYGICDEKHGLFVWQYGVGSDEFRAARISLQRQGLLHPRDAVQVAVACDDEVRARKRRRTPSSPEERGSPLCWVASGVAPRGAMPEPRRQQAALRDEELCRVFGKYAGGILQLSTEGGRSFNAPGYDISIVAALHCKECFAVGADIATRRRVVWGKMKMVCINGPFLFDGNIESDGSGGCCTVEFRVARGSGVNLDELRDMLYDEIEKIRNGGGALAGEVSVFRVVRAAVGSKKRPSVEGDEDVAYFLGQIGALRGGSGTLSCHGVKTCALMFGERVAVVDGGPFAPGIPHVMLVGIGPDDGTVGDPRSVPLMGRACELAKGVDVPRLAYNLEKVGGANRIALCGGVQLVSKFVLGGLFTIDLSAGEADITRAVDLIWETMVSEFGGAVAEGAVLHRVVVRGVADCGWFAFRCNHFPLETKYYLKRISARGNAIECKLFD